MPSFFDMRIFPLGFPLPTIPRKMIIMTRSLTALPVYNEAHHVLPVLDEVLRYCREVLVVDDGSRDGTAEILAAYPPGAAATSTS